MLCCRVALIIFFFKYSLGLVCYEGTRISLSNSLTTCNTVIGEQCISASLITPTLADNGTKIYTCGNCSYFQSQYFNNVSCCNSGDLCQTLGSLPNSGSCDAIINQSFCNARNDCYWCNNSIVSTGICKSLSNFLAPCFAISLYMPPPICESIKCHPIIPSYTVNKLSLKYLTDFGLPSIPYPVNVELGLDLESREIRVLSNNVTHNFCTLDQEFISWCGINSTTFPIFFKYCIVAESWPQKDVYGWITNTTFTSNHGFDTLYPAVCACLNPGRGYYFTTALLETQAYFGPACRGEHALLAFYILLMMVTTMAFIYVIYDIVVLVLSTYYRRLKFSASKTLAVKACLICYFLITIVDQALWITPLYSGVQSSIVGLFRLLGIIFLELSLAFAIFTFCELLLGSKVLGEQNDYFIKFLAIFKWILLGSSIFILIATVIFASLVAWYVQKFSSTSISNISIFIIYQVNAVALAKTVFYLLMALVFIIIAVSAFILAYTSYRIKVITDGSGKSSKQARIIIYRNVFLIIAIISAFIWLGFIAIYCYISLYALGGVIESPFISQYQGTIGSQWIIWGMFLSELITVLLVALAMRTKVKSSWLFNYILATLNISRISKTSETSENTASISSIQGVKMMSPQDEKSKSSDY